MYLEAIAGGTYRSKAVVSGVETNLGMSRGILGEAVIVPIHKYYGPTYGNSA